MWFTAPSGGPFLLLNINFWFCIGRFERKILKKLVFNNMVAYDTPAGQAQLKRFY